MNWRQRFFNRLFRYVRKALYKLPALVVLMSLFLLDLYPAITTPFNFINNALDVPIAEATTGDFATFEESTGGTVINSNGTPLEVTWGNSVDISANLPLQVNDSDIDLSEGGKYLVLYNVWAEEGSGGGNRRGLNTYLTLDGTSIPYGRASGYLRDSEGLTSAYVNGGTIIDAGAGDDLQVFIQRDDSNSGATSVIQDDTNGISVIKLNDNRDYLRANLAATSSAINGNTSFTDVSFDTADEVDTGSFEFSPSSGDFTLVGDAGKHYIVTVNIGLRDTTVNTTRQNYEMRLTLGGSEIDGTRVSSYMRGSDEHRYGQLVYTGIITKTSSSDQTLNVEIRRESSGGSNTLILGGQTGITMMEIPDSAEVIKLTDTSGTQTTSLTGQDLTFNNAEEVDSSAFSHSVGSNPERINIDKNGDYLFFSTAYTETTSSGQNRQPFRIDWYTTGILENRGAFGGYNRANSTFTAGASGAIMLSGLTTSDYVSLQHIDETSSSPVDSTFAPDRIALQGVVLNNNFYGLDTVVSASGTQIANTDITTTDFYVGGKFVIKENTGSRNVTTINITESGTVDAANGIENIELYYDIDSSAPYDCAGESYSGSESQFGSTDANGFSGADGIASFTDAVGISTTASLCLYTILDITASSTDGDILNLSIADPANDITTTGGGSIGPGSSQIISGTTELQNAELTQTHFHWLQDDGVEGSATSINGDEDIHASGFANGTISRLRMQVSNEGSTSSLPVQLRLEYGIKVSTCEAVDTWTDVGAGGGDWDMSDSAFITDGNNSSDLTVVNGGTTNENSVHIISNGALRDTSSQLSFLTFGTTNFLEAEFSIEPTVTAPEGTTYCFRLSDAGDVLKNYSQYPEATLSADALVSSISSQVANLDVGGTAQYVGGTFVFSRTGGNRAVTEITIAETGTIDAQNDLDNIELWYESINGDCTADSFNGGETQFGVTDTDGFSGANGTSTFTDSVNIQTSSTMCVYVVLDVGQGATDGETIDIEITDPSTDVTVAASTVAPSTVVELSGSTVVEGPVLTQIHYHWRNDDGSEVGASSASGDSEDTPIDTVFQESTKRLRIEVSNEGSVNSQPINYRLEYGTKISTCSNVVSWIDVGAVGGAWDMSPSANISDGNTTDISGFAFGEVTNENSSFDGVGALRETSSESGAITLSTTEFTELEYSIEATIDSGFNTNYCFRVTAVGEELNDYQIYPELTTSEKQDFYVQRGEITITGTTTTLIAGIDYIAPAATSSAFVRITNNNHTGSGRDDSAVTNQQSDDVTAYIADQSNLTSSFTITRPPVAINNTRVAWEIVEFVGIQGTDNEMIVRDVGEVYIGIGSFYATGSVPTTITDDDDVAVFITGHRNYTGNTTNYNDGLATALWSPTSTVPVFQRGDADADIFVSYAVVEFTGANWDVQRIEHQYTSDGTPEVESIEAIPSVTKGFIHAQKRVGEGLSGLDEFGHQVFLSSLGAVTFQLRPGVNNPSEHVSVAWVLSNSQSGDGEMNVFQASGDGFSGTSLTSVSISFTSEPGVNTTNASIFGNHDTNGTGSAYPRAISLFYLASSTHFEIWRSEAGQNIDYRVEVVEWPVADTGMRQNYYRFYVDNDAIEPTDAWPVGATNLGENTSITSTDDPLGENERVRIRMSLKISNATLPQNVASFKLQYGLQVTSCSAIETWNDVGAPGSGIIWRGYDATPIDGTEVATDTPATGALKLTPSDVAGTYEESNNSAVNPYAVAVGEDVEYDWLVEHNGAAQRSDYCFRMVESDGTTLDGYTNYPTLRTTGYTPVIDDWRWYDDETNETPINPLASENITPVDIINGDVIKLRAVVTEVENASGANLKFALQYSEYSDFSDGGNFVTSTTSCTASSTWCYADGAGVDNVVIDERVIINADACSGGSGNGCGTHNEEPDDSSTHSQPAGSSMEFEFTIQQVAPRVNNVYYFRLYDTGSDDALVASSSYPSLVTQGSQLAFVISGVDAGQSIAGIVTDATTSAASIPFGNMTYNNSYEAAQQINVNTNATQGYQILMYSTQQLTSDFGDIIPAITSINAAPTGWSTACTTAEIGCFGYHSTDGTLNNASSRFSPTDSYAAFSTTGEEIMYSSLPTNDTHEIIYRIQFTEFQPAGDYEADIVYIAVPVF